MILVTGSTGMLGSHLLYYFAEKGIKVRGLIRNKNHTDKILKTFSRYSKYPENLMANIEWAIGDVTDFNSIDDALNNIEKVYHTAALVTFNKRLKNQIFETNIKGTANIVNLCLEKKIQKLCFVSSIAALGQNDNGSPITEDTLWKPSKHISAYSLSKYHSEMEVWRGITEGLNAVIINPSVILGPGDWKKGSPSFFDFTSKGLTYYTTGTNGFVDVKDVVKAMVTAMEGDFSGERFTISAENFTYKDFFTMVADSMGVKPPSRNANRTLLFLAQKFESLKSLILNNEPRITRDTIDIAQKVLLYSNIKSIEKLGMNYGSINKTIKDIGLKYRNETKI